MTQKPVYDRHSVINPRMTQGHEQLAQEEEPPPYEPFVEDTLPVAGPSHGTIFPRQSYHPNSPTVEQTPSRRADRNSSWSKAERLSPVRPDHWPTVGQTSPIRVEYYANWPPVEQTSPIRVERHADWPAVEQASPIRSERNTDRPAVELNAPRTNRDSSWSMGRPTTGHNNNGPIVDPTAPRADRNINGLTVEHLASRTVCNINQPMVEHTVPINNPRPPTVVLTPGRTDYNIDRSTDGQRTLRTESPAACRANMHDTESSFGTFGLLAAILCFPMGIAFCFMDKRTVCRRCGLVLSAGCQ